MTVSPLDEKLNFDDHIQSKISKWNKFIGIIKRLSRAFRSDAFITIYKSFIRPHLDYAELYTANLIMIQSPRKSKMLNIEHIWQ